MITSFTLELNAMSTFVCLHEVQCSSANQHVEAACWSRAREPGTGPESWALLLSASDKLQRGEMIASLRSQVTCQ